MDHFAFSTGRRTEFLEKELVHIHPCFLPLTLKFSYLVLGHQRTMDLYRVDEKSMEIFGA